MLNGIVYDDDVLEASVFYYSEVFIEEFVLVGDAVVSMKVILDVWLIFVYFLDNRLSILLF